MASARPVLTHDRLSGMIALVKSNPKETPEYEAFSAALKRVLSVPRSVVKAQIDAEKQTKAQKRASRLSASDHVLGDKD